MRKFAWSISDAEGGCFCPICGLSEISGHCSDPLCLMNETGNSVEETGDKKEKRKTAPPKRQCKTCASCKKQFGPQNSTQYRCLSCEYSEAISVIQAEENQRGGKRICHLCSFEIESTDKISICYCKNYVCSDCFDNDGQKWSSFKKII